MILSKISEDPPKLKNDKISILYGAKYTRIVDDIIWALLRMNKYDLTIIPELAKYKDNEGTERLGRRKTLHVMIQDKKLKNKTPK